jgi:transglutaminase-like putative cysteine protease
MDLDDAQALRNACIQVEIAADGTHIILPHYEEMVRRSMPELAPIATRLVAIARASGLHSTRELVGLFASFVQSIEYSLQREGGIEDGRERLGVQMPVTTVHARKGDCDSVSLVLVTLLRAA